MIALRDVLLRKKLLFFWILSKLLPPPSLQFGQLVQLFFDVEIQDLKVSLGLKILYILCNTRTKKQLKVQIILEQIDSFY